MLPSARMAAARRETAAQVVRSDNLHGTTSRLLTISDPVSRLIDR